MSNISETCHECDGLARLTVEPREIRTGSRTVSVEVEVMRCDECGETYLRPGAMNAALRAAADVARREDGLLTPTEIVSLRQRYGITQTELETILGSGPKTVTRWERGTIPQSAMADTLMRLLILSPASFNVAAKRVGIAPELPEVVHGGTPGRTADLNALLEDLAADAEAEGAVLPFAPAFEWGRALVGVTA